jgi:hypothetical protein
MVSNRAPPRALYKQKLIYLRLSSKPVKVHDIIALEKVQGLRAFSSPRPITVGPRQFKPGR